MLSCPVKVAALDQQEISLEERKFLEMEQGNQKHKTANTYLHHLLVKGKGSFPLER